MAPCRRPARPTAARATPRAADRRRRRGEPRAADAIRLAPRLHRPDEAADHRAAARHDRPGDGPRDPRGARASELGHWAWLTFWTLVGGTLAAGSANAINCYLDRDIDELMARTRRRPLPAHQVEPERAVVFGIVLGVVSFVLLAWFVNLLAAFLTLLAIAFYVVVYTIHVKRTTPQNIVIGGAAGALPPVIGWAAVTGNVGVPALLLFALVFYWTPPHFWALSLRIREGLRRGRRADAARSSAASPRRPARSGCTRS